MKLIMVKVVAAPTQTNGTVFMRYRIQIAVVIAALPLTGFNFINPQLEGAFGKHAAAELI